MSRPLAVVASVIPVHSRVLGTAPRNVPRLPAVVTGRHVGALGAVFGEMTLAITSVTARRRLVFAISCKMTGFVAFVALFAVPVEPAAVARPCLATLPGEVTWLVAFIARAA